MSLTNSTSVTQQESNVVETLRAARALIAESKHWTQGGYARRSKRAEGTVGPHDPDAQAWCAVGALKRINGPHQHAAALLLAEAVLDQPVFSVGNAQDRIVHFNDADGRRHRDVVQAFDKAIAKAEGRVS